MAGHDVRLSKLLSHVLRHAAEKEGLNIGEDGFVDVSELLRHKSFVNRYTLEDIQKVVDNNDKKRFTLFKNSVTGKYQIRANQGHTIKKVQNLDLTPILQESEAPTVIHGTYMKNWNSIKEQGLSRMERLHIHFSPGEPGDSGVISGMRKSCEIYIYIDIDKALADGIKFYKSSNNVILSSGNESGILEPKYFKKVEQLKPTRKEIPVPIQASK